MAAVREVEKIDGAWVQTMHEADPTNGCFINLIFDPTTGMPTFACAEQECAGECILEIADTLDDKGNVVKRRGTCTCGG